MSAFEWVLVSFLALVVVGKLIRFAMWRRWRRAGARPWLPRLLRRRLGTNAEQEAVITREIDTLRELVAGVPRDWWTSRADVANAVRGDRFDPKPVDDAFTRHGETLDKLREAAAASLGRIHAVLDAGQRGQLARMIEHGLYGARGCHGYARC